MRKNRFGGYRTTTNKTWQCMCRHDDEGIKETAEHNNECLDQFYWYKNVGPIRLRQACWWFWRVRK